MEHLLIMRNDNSVYFSVGYEPCRLQLEAPLEVICTSEFEFKIYSKSMSETVNLKSFDNILWESQEDEQRRVDRLLIDAKSKLLVGTSF